MARETPDTLGPDRLLDYIERDVPFVYADPGAQNWRSVRLWKDTDYLADRVTFSSMPGFTWGENKSVWDHPDRFRVPGFSGRDWTDADRMHRPLTRFLDTYEKGSNGGQCLLSANMKCMCPDLLNDFPLPWPLAGASRRMLGGGNWPSLYVYPKGSALRMHVDTSSKWQYWTTLHTGSKHVRIISFSDWSKHLLKYFSPSTSGGKQPGLDIFNIDLVANPELAKVTVYEAVVHAGDEWYTPTAAAHAMIQLESPTINTVIKWIDEAHNASVARLCAELASGRMQSSFRGNSPGSGGPSSASKRLSGKEAAAKETACNLLTLPDPTLPRGAAARELIDASKIGTMRGKTFWQALATPEFCHEVSRGCETSGSICGKAFGPNHIGYCLDHGYEQCEAVKRACNRTQAMCWAAIPGASGAGAAAAAAAAAATAATDSSASAATPVPGVTVTGGWRAGLASSVAQLVQERAVRMGAGDAGAMEEELLVELREAVRAELSSAAAADASAGVAEAAEAAGAAGLSWVEWGRLQYWRAVGGGGTWGGAGAAAAEL
jgi:hypothetical protein